MTTNRPANRTRQILIVVVTMLAVRALLGDEIAGFIDGLYVGFTDEI